MGQIKQKLLLACCAVPSYAVVEKAPIMKPVLILFGFSMIAFFAGCGRPRATLEQSVQAASLISQTNITMEKLTRTDAEWQKLLRPEQYRVARKHGTERAFTGEYWNNHDKGIYRCIACGLELFNSDTKFDSDLRHMGTALRRCRRSPHPSGTGQDRDHEY